MADGAARPDGGEMIAVPAGMRVLVATKPVDFRRGADSLAAQGPRAAAARSVLGDDLHLPLEAGRPPEDRGLGRVRAGAVLEAARARRLPLAAISDGVMRLTASQLAALVDGMDWSRLHARDVARPTATS